MCPITSCVTKLHPGHLMCRYHWFEVPPQLRTRVWRTWRAYESVPSGSTYESYRAARDEAIASV